MLPVTFSKIMGEYEALYPLWWDGGCLDDESVLVDQLGISTDLLRDLEQWQLDWEPEEDDPAHGARGAELHARLQAEVPTLPVLYQWGDS